MTLEVVKTLTPAEELIRDLTSQIDKMYREANDAIVQEKERSDQWCHDRWQRMNDEARDIRAHRDALLKAWSDAQVYTPIVESPHP